MNGAFRRWSVVLVVPRYDQFLVISRGFQPKNVNFLGGDSEPGDMHPRDTVLRELREEAGLASSPKHLKLLDKWRGEAGQPVFAYYVGGFSGRTRSSDEGKTFWTSKTALLTSKQAEFAQYNKRLLERLGR